MAQYLELDNPGIHSTAAIDCGIVLSGQATLEVNHGGNTRARIALNVDDTYVQNGTRHRWSNVDDMPAVRAMTTIRAHRLKLGR